MRKFCPPIQSYITHKIIIYTCIHIHTKAHSHTYIPTHKHIEHEYISISGRQMYRVT